MQHWLEPLAGGIVLAITLLDVFFTVLYARAGTGLLAPWLHRGVWHVFRSLAGRTRTGLLDYCGPAQLVSLVVMWGGLLALGAALVIHPALGTGVESSSGSTDTDFVTALLVGGSSMSIVGASDYGPTTAGYKLLFLFDSLVGMSVTSLTITYVMQVYTAVRSRNTLALALHAQSGETGDAAELIAHWGPRGRFDGGYNNLSTLAGQLAAIKEMHHFYPVLFYFRFRQTFYAPPRMLLLTMDAAALVRTALDSHELGWLQESAALEELERTGTLLLRTLRDTFPTPHEPHAPAARPQEQWLRRYSHAVERLRDAGIPTRAEHDEGAREYARARSCWQPEIEALTRALGWPLEEVDRGVFGERAPRQQSPHRHPARTP